MAKKQTKAGKISVEQLSDLIRMQKSEDKISKTVYTRSVTKSLSKGTYPGDLVQLKALEKTSEFLSDLAQESKRANE